MSSENEEDRRSETTDIESMRSLSCTPSIFGGGYHGLRPCRSISCDSNNSMDFYDLPHIMPDRESEEESMSDQSLSFCRDCRSKEKRIENLMESLAERDLKKEEFGWK